jgi:hypothetical protein
MRSLVSPISVQIHMMHALKNDSAELTERLCAVSSDVVDYFCRREDRVAVFAAIPFADTDRMVCYLTQFIP